MFITVKGPCAKQNAMFMESKGVVMAEERLCANHITESVAEKVPAWVISLGLLLIGVGMFFLVYANWTEWESGKSVQSTEDAYMHAENPPCFLRKCQPKANDR